MRLRLTTTLEVTRDTWSKDAPGLAPDKTVDIVVSVTGDVEPGVDGLNVNIIQVDDGHAGEFLEQPEDLTFMEGWSAEDQLREAYLAATTKKEPREDAR